MHIKPAFIFLFLCGLLLNAKAQNALDSALVNVDSVLLKIRGNQTGYTTFSGRAKMAFDDGKAEQDFQTTIRLKRDSIVWMSISGAMNVEGARLHITPDTFELLNKINNEYLGRGFGYIDNWILFSVNFPMLQQIITGEKLDINERASTAVKDDSNYIVYFENEHMLEILWVNSQNYTISKIVLKDKMITQQMTITFDGYNQLEEKPFSYHRLIEVNRNGATIKLTIEFTKAKLNENLSYPFEVSGRYKHIQDQ